MSLSNMTASYDSEGHAGGTTNGFRTHGMGVFLRGMALRTTCSKDFMLLREFCTACGLLVLLNLRIV